MRAEAIIADTAGAGTMDEAPKPIEIEINAPHQEAQEAVFMGTPQITGDISTSQLSGDIPLSDNVVYSMGPDGQLIAIEKPPFSWKQFGIGAGIPSLLLLLPILLLIATTSPYDDPWQYHTHDLTKASGTTYSLEIQHPTSLLIEGCHVNTLQEDDWLYNYNCHLDNPHDENITIVEYNRNTGAETIVGNWSKETGLVEFDTGIDHGEYIEFTYETYDSDLERDSDTADTFGAITGIMCFVAPITALVLLIVGFSTDRKGLGFGGVTGLVLYPVIAFFGFIALLEWGW